MVLSVFAHVHASSLEESSYKDFWRVERIEQSGDAYLLVMENSTVWEVKPEQIKRIQKVMDYSNKKWEKKSQKNFYGDAALEKFCQHDRVVVDKMSNENILFKDLDSRAVLCCSLHSFPKAEFPKINKIDKNGYFILLTDETEWMVSWGGSWSSCNWRIEDCVIPIRRNCISSEGGYDFHLINLDLLYYIGKNSMASNVAPIIWKENSQ